MTPSVRALVVSVSVAAALCPAADAAAQVATFQQEIPGSVVNAGFGSSVDVDGATAVFGAPSENGAQGAAYVYMRTGSTWTFVQRLVASDGAANSRFGDEVAVSGTTIAVGARTAQVGPSGSAHGAVYIYTTSGGGWSEQTKLVPSNASSGANFGWAVDLEGDILAVGANQSAIVGGTQRGQAYVFERAGGAWQERILDTAGLAAGDFFGSSVAVSGSTVCVGSNGDNVGANSNQGSAYIFVRGATWAFQQQLLASDGAADDGFGGACALDGDTVIVTAAGDDRGIANNLGAAYVFVRSGTSWTQQRKLTASDAAGGDGMATAELAGDLAVVSASSDDSSRGSVYVFERNATTWTERQKLVPPNGATLEYFGVMGLTSGALVVGAPSTSTSGRPGRVVVYSLPTTAAGVPGAPSNFQATVDGSTVRMSWGVPASGGAATSYTVLARVSPGGPVLASLPVGGALSLDVPAPNGVFIVSVRGENAAGAGAESIAATIAVPQAVPAPGAPAGLAVGVSGNAATFTWNAPSSGGAPAGYLLVASVAPGGPAIASLPLPANPRSTVIGGIPSGTYFVRMLATNGGGASGPSNEVTLTVASPAAPGAPVLNTPVVAGSTVSLSWTPGGGGTATGYLLIASATPGGPALASVPLTGTSVAVPGVPPGTYHVRLIASNGAGASAPSNEVVVVVP